MERYSKYLDCKNVLVNNNILVTNVKIQNEILATLRIEIQDKFLLNFPQSFSPTEDHTH